MNGPLSVAVPRKLERLAQRPRRAARLAALERFAAGFDPSAPAVSRPEGLAPDKEVVVSLTSYGERLETVHLAVLSVLDQTVQADKIVLYLDEGTNPAFLSGELTHLCGLRFEIRSGYQNLKPHTKYFYAMREFSEAVIITVDDDALYARDAVESLLKGHAQHPGCVVARRVHKMKSAPTGGLTGYDDWVSEWRSTRQPSLDLMATGVGGVLYPAHVIPSEALDAESIRVTCLGADDVWLKVAETAAGVPVVYAPNRMNHPLTLEGTQETALNAENVHQHANDALLEASMAYFGVKVDDFFN